MKDLPAWALTAPGNGLGITDDGYMPEFQTRSSVNNAARERMRALRQFYDDGIEWLDLMRNRTFPFDPLPVSRISADTIRIVSGAVDMSGYFTAGRRIRTTTAGAPTDDVFVASAVHAAPNTDVTINTSTGASVTAGIDGVLLLSISSLGRLAFDDSVSSDFIVPAGFTDANFADALAAADAAGGKTILLEAGVYALTQKHDIDFPVKIIGRGCGVTSLSMAAGANVDAVLDLFNPFGGFVVLEDFDINGQRPSQTGGLGYGIRVQNGADRIRMNRIEVFNTYTDGIRIDNANPIASTSEIWMNSVHVRSPGRHGIAMSDAESTLENVVVSGAVISNPGASGVADSAGIYAVGRCLLENVSVVGLDAGGTQTQRGIWFGETLAASPNEQDAVDCSLTSFRVSGTGQNARGIEVDGRRIAVGNGVIACTGPVSRGIVIGGSGGLQAPNANVVANVVVHGANVGALLEPTALRNRLRGVGFKGCNSDVIIQGDANRIDGCFSEDTVTDVLRVQNGAIGNVVHGHQLYNVNDGFTLESGSDQTLLAEIRAHIVNGDLFTVDAGALDAYIRDVSQSGVAGSLIVENCTPGELAYDRIEGIADEVAYDVSGIGTAGSPVAIGGFPGGLANGARQYLVLPHLSVGMTAAGTQTAQLRLNGVNYEAALSVTHAGVPISVQESRSPRILTPASGDLFDGTYTNVSVSSSWRFVVSIRKLERT